MNIAEDTVTPQEAANLLGVNIRTMREWIRDGRIEAKTLPGNRRKIARSAIKAFVDQSTPLQGSSQRLSIKRYAHGFEVPDNFDLITTYAELSQYTKAFAKQDFTFLLLVGSPGSGKSRQLKSDLTERHHTWIDNHASNLGLYCSAYEADGAPIVLDDINHLFKNKMACSLMKALTQTEKIRSISWESTAKALEERKVPRQFKTSSPICLIANLWNQSDADMAAIQDRALPVAFYPSADAIHQRVIELGWCDRDVSRFIGQHLSKIPQPSMREYYQAMTYRKAGMDWKQKLLKLWENR
jgi:excisionase family DNA binding protein